MRPADESDGAHPRRLCRPDAQRRILDHQADLRLHPDLLRCVKEEIGSGLAPGDELRAEHMVEAPGQGHRIQGDPDPLERPARRDAERHFPLVEPVEKVLHSRYRCKLLAKAGEKGCVPEIAELLGRTRGIPGIQIRLYRLERCPQIARPHLVQCQIHAPFRQGRLQGGERDHLAIGDHPVEIENHQIDVLEQGRGRHIGGQGRGHHAGHPIESPVPPHRTDAGDYPECSGRRLRRPWYRHRHRPVPPRFRRPRHRDRAGSRRPAFP